jgi:hypothetical protein
VSAHVLRLAAALLLAAAQTVATQPLARAGFGGGGSRASHFAPGHFAGHFNRHPFRRSHAFQPVFVVPYGWDWPYSEEPPTEGDGSVAVIPYPAPTSSGGPSGAAAGCHWDAQTFTVPSAEGGTRQIQITRC